MNNYSDKTTAQTITANLKRLGVKKVRNTRGWNGNDNSPRYTGLKLNQP